MIMAPKDTLQRFLFEHASIRGEIAHLDQSYQTVLQQRPYPPVVKQLLGEAMLSCALLAGSIKFEGEISLQFQGDARLPLLLVQCDHRLQLRAYAKYQEQSEAIDYREAFLGGTMSLMIGQNNQSQSYQSKVPITSGSMSDNLMHYFAQSEQLATQVCLAVSDDQAAGMILQLMPGQNSLQREQFWEYAVHLGKTLKNDELLTLNNETILHRLYHETELRLYDARPVRFQCRCTPVKMKQVLRLLGESDVKQLLQEQGAVTVCCDFCNKQFAFDAVDIHLMFHPNAYDPP